MSDQTQDNTDLSIFDEGSGSTDGVTEPAANSTTDSKLQAAPGLINRNNQIKVWADRVENGEVEIDALPANLGWLKPLVQDEVSQRSKAKDIDSIVEQKLAAIRAEERKAQEKTRFEQLRAEANSLDLNESDKKLVNEKVKSLKAKGLSDADALEEALGTYKLLAASGEHAVQELKRAMKIPLQNKQVDGEHPEFGSEGFSKWGTSKDRVQALEKIRLSGGFK